MPSVLSTALVTSRPVNNIYLCSGKVYCKQEERARKTATFSCSSCVTIENKEGLLEVSVMKPSECPLQDSVI